MTDFGNWIERNKFALVMGSILSAIAIFLEKLFHIFSPILNPVLDYLKLSGTQRDLVLLLLISWVIVILTRIVLDKFSQNQLKKYDNTELVLIFAGSILITAFFLTQASLGMFCIGPQAVDLPTMNSYCASPSITSAGPMVWALVTVSYFLLAGIALPAVLLYLFVRRK